MVLLALDDIKYNPRSALLCTFLHKISAHFLHIFCTWCRASTISKTMITTRLYLDTRRSDDNSPAPLKLAIYWKGSESYLFTGFKLPPAKWDPKARAAKDSPTQLSVSMFKMKVDTLLLEWQNEHRLDGLNSSDIRRMLERELSPGAADKARFLSRMEAYAASREKPRTTEIYKATIDRIRAFDRLADALRFEDITIEWLESFDSFLARTSKKRNSRNIHFRNIRAVFNDALKKCITTYYPFRSYEIRQEPTMKRALSVEQLRTLFAGAVQPWQQKYVDFFKISFMLIGMNTEDLVHASGVVGGRLEYYRAKTYKPYSIKVEEECAEIIERYRGKSRLLNIMDTYGNTHNWTSRIDKALKDISEPLGLPRISMYWARHSWATIAAELDIPKETITAALGQSSSTVTDIYIKFDRAKIDRANRQVLDYVLYDKKPQDIYDLLREMNSNLIANKANKFA